MRITTKVLVLILVLGCVVRHANNTTLFINKILTRDGARGKLFSLDKEFTGNRGSIIVIRAFYENLEAPKDTFVMIIGIKNDPNGNFAFLIYGWPLQSIEEKEHYQRLINTDSIGFLIGERDFWNDELFWNDITQNLRPSDSVRLD